MNYKIVLNNLGKVLLTEAFLLLFPFGVGFIYGENETFGNVFYNAYLMPVCILLLFGLILSLIPSKEKAIYAREGLVLVAVCWIVLSLVGAVPFVIMKAIPSYVDALFETVSGFTTTGASILSEVETLPKSISFWRLFTHWIGGMGVLVFVLAILPSGDNGVMNIYRAESPGPTSGKLVSKMKFTARILYLIYIVLTVIEFIFLVFDMPVFDAVVNSFATAGTGGFGIKNQSIGAYSNYSQWVIALFMFIFGINFNLFYLILIGQVLKAVKSEEFIVYASIVLISSLIIAFNILFGGNVDGVNNFGDAIRLSFFQVTSISSSTGFSTTNFDLWPTLSKAILFFLMLFGACAGSTGGGMKISRLIILSKSSVADLKRTFNPREIISVKLEGEVIGNDTIKAVRNYFFCWFMIVVVSTLLLSIGNNFNGEVDIVTALSASVSCIGNIGPGFNLVGPTLNYGGFSALSKIWLSFVMLAGRLEIIPMLILFSPKVWSKK